MLQESERESRRAAHAPGAISVQQQAILDAAVVLFDRDGYDRTTMKAIAATCGMTDAGLYYHFTSKRALLDAVWEIPIDEDALRAPEGFRDHRAVIMFVDRVFDFAGRSHSLVKLTARQTIIGDPAALKRRARMRDTWRHGLASHFEHILDPERAVACSDAIAMILLGAIFPIMFNPRVDFASAVRAPAYRDHVKQLVSAVLPPELSLPAPDPCAP